MTQEEEYDDKERELKGRINAGLFIIVACFAISAGLLIGNAFGKANLCHELNGTYVSINKGSLKCYNFTVLEQCGIRRTAEIYCNNIPFGG